MDIRGVPTKILNNGMVMPMIGLGTGGRQLDTDDFINWMVYAVVECGYRLIDTASMYNNEDKIGKALQECYKKGIKREEMFIVTKLGSDEKDNVEQALLNSLQRLQLDFVDLYLVHWCLPKIEWKDIDTPIKQTPMHKVWQDMESMVEKGLTKSIGVSNCTAPLLLDILTYAKIKPTVNQIEIHPYFQQRDICQFMKKLGVQPMAYSPLGAPSHAPFKSEEQKKMSLNEESILREMEIKYKKSACQIVLNWHLKYSDNITVPKTLTLERLKENIESYDFDLEMDDYLKIDTLHRNCRFITTPVRGDINIPYFN